MLLHLFAFRRGLFGRRKSSTVCVLVVVLTLVIEEYILRIWSRVPALPFCFPILSSTSSSASHFLLQRTGVRFRMYTPLLQFPFCSSVQQQNDFSYWVGVRFSFSNGIASAVWKPPGIFGSLKIENDDLFEMLLKLCYAPRTRWTPSPVNYENVPRETTTTNMSVYRK